ncbi:unnamed protein product [Didymodactylos carnosus]|uniref:Uncharacterized protein n=1 Tax=Didymodactylos carnosus TaxID=1234261 RepID=A0A813XFM1_9BILA|nr:unnamed protein product [Didymodactylos carnosus]CAF0867478.1 unnamed protein product [Didymodactylos carnosus]CAF3571012.1 unnamed protein product [Didymodactylos carnosus]CAF3654939.1 unnamed protein product [Didymodactylos carnosus]
MFENMGLALDDTSSKKPNKIFKTKSELHHFDENNKNLTKQSDNYRVDIQYFYILLPYLKKFNPSCGLCIYQKYFGRRITAPNGLLLKCWLVCKGRPSCKFSCYVSVQNDRHCYIIVTNNEIKHRIKQRICRPIRAPIRSLLKDKFKAGATVKKLHNEYARKRTALEKSAFNYDVTGSTQKTFKKIKAEAINDTLLDPNEDEALAKLTENLKNEINNDGKVPGAVQVYSKTPAHVIVYTEASIRLFNDLCSSSNSVISWDATDRAQVFLQGALEVFNRENYKEFLDRAYRIVNGQAKPVDLQQTNIHACLAHIMLHQRQLVNKFLDVDLRELGMWSMALLINTNNWNEMKQNWALVCTVFMNFYTNKHDDIKYNYLLEKIRNLESDPNLLSAINNQRTRKTSKLTTALKGTNEIDQYEFNDEDTSEDYIIDDGVSQDNNYANAVIHPQELRKRGNDKKSLTISHIEKLVRLAVNDSLRIYVIEHGTLDIGEDSAEQLRIRNSDFSTALEKVQSKPSDFYKGETNDMWLLNIIIFDYTEGSHPKV